MYRIFILCSVVLLAGCVNFSTKEAAVASSGVVPCPPDEITITDFVGYGWYNAATWTAICKGEKYYCRGQYTEETEHRCAAEND